MMEHSKGKLEQGSISPWELWIGADNHIADVHGVLDIRRANAARLTTCWNEHDTLKAKADLFDELIKRCDALIDGYETVVRIGKGSFAVQSLITTLSKAKELK